MIDLKKGSRFNLKKADENLPSSDGHKGITEFCVGCNWGKIRSKGFLGLFPSTEEVDLDLSCILFDKDRKMVDYIYSPQYLPEFLIQYGYPRGKLFTENGALRHSGDDRAGDEINNDRDNEIIQVDLRKINPNVQQIFFFLNYAEDSGDFAKIPYASIRLFEGTPSVVKKVHASFNVASDPSFRGRKSMVMGKLFKDSDGSWCFWALGDPLNAENVCETMNQIKRSFV